MTANEIMEVMTEEVETFEDNYVGVAIDKILLSNEWYVVFKEYAKSDDKDLDTINALWGIQLITVPYIDTMVIIPEQNILIW